MSQVLRFAGAFACMILAAAISQLAQAQEPPPTEPILRIDAGMHTAVVRRIAVDAGCTLLATGSEDKSVRLWRLPAGRLLATLRPPIGEDNDGKIYSVAMPPDGSWIAAGGWNKKGGNHFVYIFDTRSGAILTRFGPFQVIENLAVSADGRFLAAALRNAQGLRVWERKGDSAADWQLVGQDANYRNGDLKGLAFDKTGALYAVAYDGKIRRYDRGYKGPPRSVVGRAGRQPYSIAVHPDGDRLVVGYSDTTAVEIYDTETLAWRFSADTRGLGNGNLSAVAWSAKGDTLYAGGRYAEGGQYSVRAWADAGNGPAHELKGATDSITHLLPCGDGVAVAASDPAFGLFAADGTRRLWQERVGADMRGKLREHFTVSTDGAQVRFGLQEKSGDPVLFDLAMWRLTESPQPLKELAPAETESVAVTGWENRPAPKIAGTPIALDAGENVRSLAISPDKQHVVLGTDFKIRAYDKDGNFLWDKPVPGVAWGVNITHDGRLVVAACADGTLRWYKLEDGTELLALFVHAKDLRWVAWTPKGFYMASAGGENLIGWQVNRGWTDAADFFPVARFRDTFYRPDAVGRVLADLDETNAGNRAGLPINKPRESEDIKSRLPPVIRITSPADNAATSLNQVTVAFAVRSPSGLPIKRVFAQVDGRPVEGAVATNVAAGTGQEATGQLDVKIPPRDVTITLIAETERVASEPARVDLLSIAGGAPASVVKPRLYGLIVGVGQYSAESLKLGDFPGNDADDLAQQMKKQEGLAFDRIEIKVLKDAAATHGNIVDGLQWLADTVKDADDIALLYFSGHGATTSAASYLLPVDYDPKRIVASGLSKSVILDTLRGINGRVLFFVDACYAADGLQLASISGARRLDAASLIGEFAASENGITAFASSSGRERSYGAGRNSYFTKVLIEALRGLGPQRSNVVVTDDLNYWLRLRVPKLSEGKQMPVMLMSPVAKPVPLAVLQ